MSPISPWLSIVGVGEDGWDGLTSTARQAVASAEVLFGGARHLALIPPNSATRHIWQSQISQSVDDLLTHYRGHTKVCVLASGDPMFHGIGTLITRRLDPSEYQVLPQLSAFTLACARLGWPSSDTPLVSLVNSPAESIVRHLYPGQRLVIYSRDRTTPAAAIDLLQRHGYSRSQVTVFDRIGGPAETRHDTIASSLPANEFADLNVIAVLCVADPTAHPLSPIPGLHDDAFDTDGQFTKREVRAATLARLAPLPGQTLWDVGAGTGTVGIEWMRVHPSCRCIAFEQRQDRADRIAVNARRLGVPGLQVVLGSAPAIFEGAGLRGYDARDTPPPDAIFLGGGITVPGLIEACWSRLPIGGRLVANTVTVAGEAALAAWQATHGGDLIRIAVSRAAPIGGMLAWRPLSPITQLAATKS
ncbi:precorrin-6y C5,15-methyltransferase (decarboxylating) subunit CbiE [Granulicella sp. L60]|uniref:precorrin-6y C5,15-methyltransferase (decarboxylating) subunit CbiE n=1 Tax=Granulicella sp. L60 TaxID=1641866 RepID=UPI001575FBB8|nr:precorrin-6y C5,15-methyltransferase (decarboxylating) subunit CbiE [Granulicella sp. L60]